MNIEGETNVRSSRFGSGTSEGLGEELGRFVVTTMPIPWQHAGPRVGGNPAAVLMADSMEFDVVDAQVAAAPDCDTVLAVGGGRAIDLGKYLAWKRGCRLVTVPSVLSVDAFVTPAAGLRRDSRVEYVGESTPDPLVIDYDLLRTAPDELNTAGAGDLYSIHTATRDWELAHTAGRDEHNFTPEAVATAREILADTIAAADEIRRATDQGLRAIVEGYMRVNTICLPAGHYRVEEGSEHYLFYELEERTGRPFIHGHIIGLGIYLLSHLQENDAQHITTAMRATGLKFQPADMQLSREELRASLLNLRAYVEQSKLWYTAINEREVTEAWVEEMLAGLEFG